MDPNAALDRARRALARIRAVEGRRAVTEEETDALADAFEALDGWLSKGGFLPTAWSRTTPDAK